MSTRRRSQHGPHELTKLKVVCLASVSLLVLGAVLRGGCRQAECLAVNILPVATVSLPSELTDVKNVEICIDGSCVAAFRDEFPTDASTGFHKEGWRVAFSSLSDGTHLVGVNVFFTGRPEVSASGVVRTFRATTSCYNQPVLSAIVRDDGTIDADPLRQ